MDTFADIIPPKKRSRRIKLFKPFVSLFARLIYAFAHSGHNKIVITRCTELRRPNLPSWGERLHTLGWVGVHVDTLETVDWEPNEVRDGLRRMREIAGDNTDAASSGVEVNTWIISVVKVP